MLKKTVTYTDIDEKPVTKDLYFNLRKSDVLGELSLLDRFEKFQKQIEGERRDLTTAEKQEMVDLIKEFARLSYGVRTEAGGHRKTEEVWQEFLDSEAWDIFFWGLFQDPEEFQSWMAGVLPNDLREEAKTQLAELQGQDALPFQPADTEAYHGPQTPESRGLKNLYDSTPPPATKSLDEMSSDELKARLAELEGK